MRANNIFNKLREREGIDERAVIEALPSTAPDAIASGDDESHDLWGLVLEAARLDEVVDQAVRTLEVSVLAKYAFGLAQAFNGFYHRYPILNEERPARGSGGRGGRLLPQSAGEVARADGMRRARQDEGVSDRVRVSERAPTIGVTRCSKLDDYIASVEQTGARARVLDVTREPAQGPHRDRRPAADRWRRYRPGLLPGGASSLDRGRRAWPR